MITLKNFRQYIPKDNPYESLGVSIIFLQDESGNDWYDLQNKFSVSTLKLAYDSSGIIKSFSTDVSRIMPLGLSVSEISQDKLPNLVEGSLNDGSWLFVNGEILAKLSTSEERKLQAEQKKEKLMDDATRAIAPLQDTVDLDIASESEKSQLTEWKKYRALVNRVDVSIAPDIVWPIPPVN